MHIIVSEWFHNLPPLFEHLTYCNLLDASSNTPQDRDHHKIHKEKSFHRLFLNLHPLDLSLDHTTAASGRLGYLPGLVVVHSCDDSLRNEWYSWVSSHYCFWVLLWA